MSAYSSPPAQPHGELREVLPGVHFVTGSIAMGPMRMSRNMVVLPQADGRVVIVNSVRLDDAGLATIERLGRVTDVIRLAGHHGADDPFYKDRYGATIHVIRGQTYFKGLDARMGEVYFEPDMQIDADSSLPVAGASLYVFETRPAEAILRIAQAGGTLIVGDSLQNITAPDQYYNFPAKLVMRVMGFFRPHQLGPGWVKATRPNRAEVGGILDLAFANVLPSHGEPVIGGAKEKYRPAIEKYAAGR